MIKSRKYALFLTVAAVMLLLQGTIVSCKGKKKRKSEDESKPKQLCITIAEVINDKGRVGDCCEGIEENQEIMTKEHNTVYIKNGIITKIEKKPEVEDGPKVKYGGGEKTNPPSGENTKAGGGGKDYKKETKKEDDRNAPGKLVNGKWKAGEGDDGLESMTRNINAATGKNWTANQIREANGKDLDKKNPPIIRGKLYNLPNK